VAALGRADSDARTPAQTIPALFWTDHDLRQWNDGMLRLAVAARLDLVQTARMLAMAHVAGGDAMIACFDAKYKYWFWRPYQAVPRADTDDNPATMSDRRGIRSGPRRTFPSTRRRTPAIAPRLPTRSRRSSVRTEYGSRSTAASPDDTRLRAIPRGGHGCRPARVLVGFHFRNSDQEGSNLGRHVARYVVTHYFQRAS
jgi:hypothetical protein